MLSAGPVFHISHVLLYHQALPFQSSVCFDDVALWVNRRPSWIRPSSLYAPTFFVPAFRVNSNLWNNIARNSTNSFFITDGSELNFDPHMEACTLIPPRDCPRDWRWLRTSGIYPRIHWWTWSWSRPERANPGQSGTRGWWSKSGKAWKEVAIQIRRTSSASNSVSKRG